MYGYEWCLLFLQDFDPFPFKKTQPPPFIKFDHGIPPSAYVIYFCLLKFVFNTSFSGKFFQVRSWSELWRVQSDRVRLGLGPKRERKGAERTEVLAVLWQGFPQSSQRPGRLTPEDLWSSGERRFQREIWILIDQDKFLCDILFTD